MLYPLKFRTIYKDKLWGGQKIREYLGKDFGDLPNCGETWELSGVQGNVSVVKNGALEGKDLKTIIDEFGAELIGKSIHEKYGSDFPLLIKFIDANDDLSIQVHPDDELAQKRHGSFGKTEMWYVIQADEGSSLISGFNQQTDREKYLEYFNSGRLTDILNREKVKSDDVFFLPAGRVHTIGRGLLIAEIQQTSDITYRIYDFDRVDENGNKRDLHVEEALDAIDYNFYPEYKSAYEDEKNKRVRLVKCPYFTTNKLSLDTTFSIDLSGLDSFKIYVCIEGNGTFRHMHDTIDLNLGDVVLLPAGHQKYDIETSSGITLLESYIEG